MMNKGQGKGIFFGLSSGILWALDTVLIGIVLSRAVFLSTEQVIFLAPLVSTLLHDTLSAIWMAIYMLFRGELKQTLSKLRTKSGLFVVLAALMGGPVGMTGYVLAVKYIGASYTASISAVYPAIGALFAFIFLKDKLGLRSWFGLLISIGFIFFLGYSNEGIATESYLLGFFFAAMCVVGWGLECVIIAYGMKDDEVSPEQALQIRQLTSALTFAAIIIPVFGGHFLTVDVLMSKEFPLIAVIALAGTASYVFYYKAINHIGPTKAMALNITYAAWTVIIGMIVLGTAFSPKLLLCSIGIIVGSILTVASPKEVIGISFRNGEKKTA
ncbi:DMT family transporter [Ectobacillus antri]|jgi:drug/metabolite transporter (DMT)-like permease|uniref:DMT family transporter n=2 Tax=Ectobacillus antri TaxID=2486280 RepID=A0ABT6H8Y0_9BACI|nr:DMT family transporter [Ectobacillus antri]MDG4657600.1 DMT family transporter [Ectobacillus antri]MDG5755120.1 DMT family transporter [Ectobacillus antri]